MTSPAPQEGAKKLERPKNTVIAVAPHCPAALAKETWCVEDLDLKERTYEGSISQVWRAIDKRSGITVALKVYRRSRLNDIERHQVAREIWLHAQLAHPNVIALHAAWKDPEFIYLALEWADQGSVFRFLHGPYAGGAGTAAGGAAPAGKLSERKAVTLVMEPTLSALVYVHGLGVIHRDIKPENILLTAAYEIKLADFGLSIHSCYEVANTRLGTVDYLAPEILDCPVKEGPHDFKADPGCATYGAKVDSWSVGVLAFELLTGKTPFQSSSPNQTLRKIKDPNHPIPIPEGISPAAADFIRRALVRDPEQRISMKELAEHPWIVGFGPVQPLLLPSAADGGSAANAGGTQTVNGAPAPSPLRVVKQVSEQGDGAGGSAYGERTRSRMAAAAMVPPHSSAAAAAAAGYTARTFAPQPGGYGTTPPAIGSLSRAVAAAATPAPQPANVQNHYVESGTPGDTVRVHKLLASAVAVPTRTPELGATTPSPALAKGAAAAAAAAGSSSTGNGTGRAVASTAAAAVPSPDPRLPLPPATYSATTPVSYNTTVTTSGGVGGVGGGKPPLSQPRGAAPASATPTAMRTHLQQAASPLPAAAAVQPVLISTSMLPRRAAAASPVIMAATMSGSAAPLAATSVAVAGGGGLRADSPYLSTAATVVDMAAQRVRRASADYPSRVTGAASPALAATGVMGTPVGAAAASGALYPAPWHEICRQPQAGYAVAMARAAAAARDRQQAAAAAAASRRASEATGNKATTGARLLPGPTALGVAADQSQQDASAQGAASLLPFAADPTTEPPPAAGVAVGTPCVFMPQQPVAALGTRIIPAPRGPAPPYAGMITPLPGAAAGAAAAGGGGGYNHHHLGGVLTLPAEPVPRNQLQFAPTPVPPAPEMHRGGGGGPSLQEEDSTQGLLMSHAAAGSGGHGAAGSGSSSSAGGGSSAPVGKLR